MVENLFWRFCACQPVYFWDNVCLEAGQFASRHNGCLRVLNEIYNWMVTFVFKKG